MNERQSRVEGMCGAARGTYRARDDYAADDYAAMEQAMEQRKTAMPGTDVTLEKETTFMEGIAGKLGDEAPDECARGGASETEADALVLGARIRQRYARYPELFAAKGQEPATDGWPASAPGERTTLGHSATVLRRERPVGDGSGLVVVALRHAGLTPMQRHALSTFRLEQCTLCGWYDPELVLATGSSLDPVFEALADEAVHVVVGTHEGVVLGYFCIEPAVGTDDSREPTWSVADRERPLFPTERDLFGPDVFASLPVLATTPIACLRELSYLMRNQAVASSSRLATLAVVEVISAMGQLLLHESSWLVAAVGHMDLEARRLTYELDMPALYAPHAPQMTTPYGVSTGLWTRDVDLPGRFWPVVFAVADVVAYRAHFDWLDALLEQPVNQIIRTLVALRREPRRHLPVAFTQTQHALGEREGETDGAAADARSPVAIQEWTAEPGCDTRPVAPAPASGLARVAAVRSGLAAR